MANRNFPQSRQYSMHLMPVSLDMSVAIGATGAPTIEAGSGLGIASITRLAVGQYRIQLADNYSKLLSVRAMMQAPVTGSAVAGGAFVTGTVYQIVSLGNTTQAQWVAAGLPSGITADVGVTFKASGAGAGTGTVKALGSSGINAVEMLGNNINMLNNQPFNAGQGGYIDIQTMGPTNSSTTTPIPTDPANGSKLNIDILLSNSSIQ